MLSLHLGPQGPGTRDVSLRRWPGAVGTALVQPALSRVTWQDREWPVSPLGLGDPSRVCWWGHSRRDSQTPWASQQFHFCVKCHKEPLGDLCHVFHSFWGL